MLQHKKKRFKVNYFLAGYLLSAVILAVSFAMVKVWPFRDHYALIVDSIHQYLPFYTDFRNKLAEGSSLMYSWSGGLGYNFWSTYAYYLATPSNFLLFFVPMKYVGDFMDLMIILRVGLCGGCFTWYLHKRKPEENWSPLAFGLAFALSNLILGYYFNLMWLDSIAMTPVVMHGIDQIVKGKSGRTFCLSLFYAIWCNYYIGFMLCLFSCLYLLVCYISETNQFSVKHILKTGVKFAWFALLAGGMAAAVLFPAYIGLSSTEALNSGSTFPESIQFYTGFLDMLKQHMAFLEPVNISDTQVGLNAYCGIGTVFFALLFLFNKSISKRKKVSYLMLSGFLMLSFSFNILNYIWHGFHIQNGLPNRFAFLYIAVIILMAYESYNSNYSLWRIMAAYIVPAVLIMFFYITNDGSVSNWVYDVNFGILTGYVLFVLLKNYLKNFKSSLYVLLISILLITELTANCTIGVKYNSGDTREKHIADQASFQNLMGTQSSDDFFRSEVDRQWMRNVTMYSGGKGLVMFNSVMYGTVVDFSRQLGIEARTNKNGYYGVTKLMNDILGIRYLLSPVHEADTMYQFDYLNTDGELSLYENPNALSIGFMVNDDIKAWNIYDGNPLEVQNAFVQLATGLDPIYSYDRAIELEDGVDNGILIPEDKQVYFYMGVNVDKLELNTPECSKAYDNYTDFVFPVNEADEQDLADFTVTLGKQWKNKELKAYVYICSNEAYQEVADKLAENQMEEVQVNGNKVSGTITADKAGTLLLTIPYDTGWTLKVDGEKTDTYAIGEALTGVHLESGTHTIEMNYVSPGFPEGVLFSIEAVLLFLLTIVFENRKKGRD